MSCSDQNYHWHLPRVAAIAVLLAGLLGACTNQRAARMESVQTSAVTTVASTFTVATPPASVAKVSFRDPAPALTMRPLGSVTVPPVISGNYRVAIGDLGVAVGSWPYGRPADPDHIDDLWFDGTSRGFDVRGGLGAVMAYGPGDVVYTMDSQKGSGNDFALAAIAVAGDRVATVVASTPASIIEFTEVSPAVFGHGQDGLVRRDRDVRPTLVNYVDIAGTRVAPQPSEPSFTFVNDPSVKYPQTRIASSFGDLWNLEIESSPDRATQYGSASPPGPTSDGAGVFWTDVGPAVETSGLSNVPTMWVIAQMKRGGGTKWWSVPDGWQVVATDVWGTVLAKQADSRLDLAMANFAN